MYVCIGSLAGDLATLGAGGRTRTMEEFILYGAGLLATVGVPSARWVLKTRPISKGKTMERAVRTPRPARAKSENEIDCLAG